MMLSARAKCHEKATKGDDSDSSMHFLRSQRRKQEHMLKVSQKGQGGHTDLLLLLFFCFTVRGAAQTNEQTNKSSKKKSNPNKGKRERKVRRGQYRVECSGKVNMGVERSRMVNIGWNGLRKGQF